MRIAWCTPFGRRSAIGQISVQIVEELLRNAEVDIWHPETAEPLETSASCIGQLTGGPADAARLAAYDLAVYNLGNHPDHREIFEVSCRTPGLVVLHDLVMQDFFYAYYLQGQLKDRYSAAMHRWYGAAGLAAVRGLLDGINPDFLRSPAVLEYPLFEEAIAGAYAVVTHSRFAVERVQSRFPGIVRQLALPRPAAPDFRIVSRNELPLEDGRLLAITVGDVNRNKRVNSVLEALRADPALAASIFYIVIGALAPEYGRELVRLVKEYELEKTVRFTGYMPDELLAAYLTHADFCIALRHPTTEAASASVIAQLAYGKPAIVSATGFYSELPDDCVLKVRIDHEQEDLCNAMHRLADDASLRRETGRRARMYSHETFRADRYAQGILQLAVELLDAKPLLGFTDRVAGELDRMGVASGDPIIQTIAEVASGLFGD